jgi:hypothetical protein
LEVDADRMAANLAAAGVGTDMGESEALVARALEHFAPDPTKGPLMAFATHDGVRIYWRLDGAADKPVLVLLNSIGTDLSLYDAASRC